MKRISYEIPVDFISIRTLEANKVSSDSYLVQSSLIRLSLKLRGHLSRNRGYFCTVRPPQKNVVRCYSTYMFDYCFSDSAHRVHGTVHLSFNMSITA